MTAAMRLTSGAWPWQHQLTCVQRQNDRRHKTGNEAWLLYWAALSGSRYVLVQVCIAEVEVEYGSYESTS